MTLLPRFTHNFHHYWVIIFWLRWRFPKYRPTSYVFATICSNFTIKLSLLRGPGDNYEVLRKIKPFVQYDSSLSLLVSCNRPYKTNSQDGNLPHKDCTPLPSTINWKQPSSEAQFSLLKSNNYSFEISCHKQ